MATYKKTYVVKATQEELEEVGIYYEINGMEVIFLSDFKDGFYKVGFKDEDLIKLGVKSGIPSTSFTYDIPKSLLC